MPRPISIKDQTIIDAARAIFLERGFAATTAEVSVPPRLQATASAGLGQARRWREV